MEEVHWLISAIVRDIHVSIKYERVIWSVHVHLRREPAEKRASKGTNLDCSTLISTPRALLRMTRREIESSGEPWSKIVSDCFQQKTIKVFLIGPFKFAWERLNVRRAWRVSGFFPRNVEVNAPGRWATRAYSWCRRFQTTFARLIRQNNWISQFSNKTPLSYISKIDHDKHLKVKNKIKINRHLCQL